MGIQNINPIKTKAMKNLILIIFALNLNFIQAQVGIGTTSPQSTLDINGNVSFKVVSLNGGPGGSATVIDDGYYISLTPTSGSVEFILPDATLFPGRAYILRNISNTETAVIYTFGSNPAPSGGVEFFPGDSRTSLGAQIPVNMLPDASGSGGARTKTLMYISDGSNWTYGALGF